MRPTVDFGVYAEAFADDHLPAQANVSLEAPFAMDKWRATKPPSRKPKEDKRLTEELVAAAMAGDVAAIESALRAGAQPWHTDRNGGTPLHFAAYYGWPEAVRVLIAFRADPNAREHTDTGLTPLHSAAMNGHKEVVTLLLAAQADPTTHDWRQRTPLALAELRVPKLLRSVQRGGRIAERAAMDVAARGVGMNPLDAAAMNSHKEVVALLLVAKADPGSDICHAAMDRRDDAVARLLRHAPAQREGVCTASGAPELAEPSAKGRISGAPPPPVSAGRRTGTAYPRARSTGSSGGKLTRPRSASAASGR
eukprot:gnl/TRDRNA2_/TRDRNA2_188984_c0_seq1.p1 gnl/TRDRNA2_/TRDRNA2_188984_c0~~gnl/TRDRNA2_/TRDRNA2_188984_c0_seq1.p1  ORF type:complete len:309 (+),score=50.09 gnl/TRDRNA2_/TRDRNA2_188984_c0_seq1:110-1036(+)